MVPHRRRLRSRSNGGFVGLGVHGHVRIYVRVRIHEGFRVHVRVYVCVRIHEGFHVHTQIHTQVQAQIHSRVHAQVHFRVRVQRFHEYDHDDGILELAAVPQFVSI